MRVWQGVVGLSMLTTGACLAWLFATQAQTNAQLQTAAEELSRTAQRLTPLERQLRTLRFITEPLVTGGDSQAANEPASTDRPCATAASETMPDSVAFVESPEVPSTTLEELYERILAQANDPGGERAVAEALERAFATSDLGWDADVACTSVACVVDLPDLPAAHQQALFAATMAEDVLAGELIFADRDMDGAHPPRLYLARNGHNLKGLE